MGSLLVPHEYEGGDTVEGGDEKIREGEREEEIVGDCPHSWLEFYSIIQILN